MAESGQTRPGGLTALAVINFVIGGFGAIGVAGMAGAMGDAEIRKVLEESLEHAVTDQWLGIMLAAGIVEVTLLILSGVGYLGQKRVLGRVLGSVYGLLSLASNGYEATLSGFQIGTMVGIVYPLLTLLLLNTTFKDDLVH